MVIMNDLEWSMLSYFDLFENFRKIMQQTEKETLNTGDLIFWLTTICVVGLVPSVTSKNTSGLVKVSVHLNICQPEFLTKCPFGLVDE